MTQDIARQAANNFTSYKVVIHPTYERAPHLDLLDKALMEVARYLETGKGIQRLIIEIPPRSGKTLSVSELFPSWLFGRRPDTEIILASYGATLAETASRRARDYVASDTYRAIFPNTTPQEDLQKAGEWGVVGKNGEKGKMVAVGMDGAVIGKGAHLLIIDDPLKNRMEAENPNIREETWIRYDNDLRSRFNTTKRAAQIVMAQRLHTDDIIGRILRSAEAHTWTRLRLPALAEANDPLGREEGEALWEERYDQKSLLEIRDRDSYAFASQYQQRPIPKGESSIDVREIIIVDTPPKCSQVVRFWDLAVTIKKRSDYTVGFKLGITDQEDIIFLDIIRMKMKAPDMLNMMIQTAKQDGKTCPQILEGERSGISQLDYLLREPSLRGYTLDTQPNNGVDKLARASAIATRIKHGKVKMVRASWNALFLNELQVFPAGANDDQVDAMSGAYNYLTQTDRQIMFTVASVGKDEI